MAVEPERSMPQPQRQKSSTARVLRALTAATLLALKGLVMALVYAMPVLGAWAASSLAAFLNGPTWAPIVVACLAFPVLPVAWELINRYRRSRDPKTKPHILTLADRLTLRTFAVNVVFLGALLVFYPGQLFSALSARGDWFLAGRSDARSELVRRFAFGAADRFEWLYDLTHENPFGLDEPVPPPEPSEVPPPLPIVPPPPAPAASAKDGSGAPPEPTKALDPAPDPTRYIPKWPLPVELHPVVQQLPAASEQSPEAVGAFIASRVSDPLRRVKAVHDSVADRIAYDRDSYVRGDYPLQDARTVLSTRLAVCAGYSRLMVAIAAAAKLEVVYVTGVSRDSGGDVSGQGHAWNAVRLHDAWYLIDATWDAGHVDDRQFVKRYTTDYLLTPPDIFATNHLPDEERWQLKDKPISRGEFIRQPNLRPSFHAQGLSMRDPLRSQVSVTGAFVAQIENPRGVSLLANFGIKGGGLESRCEVELGATTSVTCPVPAGINHVQLFVGRQPIGVHWYVGQFEVNRRP